MIYRRSTVTRREIVERKRVVIAMFCKRKPPLRLFAEDPSGVVIGHLQDWIGLNQEPFEAFGMAPTAISILEAAETIAISQVANGYEALR